MAESEAAETKHAEEEVDIQFQPIVKLSAVETQTGEQDEEETYKRFGLLYFLRLILIAVLNCFAGVKATLVFNGRSVALEK